eukprot:GHVO01066833.1.p1 GENE.GHVO01066833.1~~GHVO01066833.1.p1  ORF type:complete len:459 (+),score=48.26 GHVO01066833.1:30-1379(+)
MTEVRAGLILFATMSYIIAVNPDILQAAGMDVATTTTATAVSGFIATAFIGMYANLPFGLAPGMGLNALFAYELVRKNALTISQALACCFTAGFAFFVISVTGFSHVLISNISLGMKKSVVVAIGLFQALAGFVALGVVKPGTYSALEITTDWGATQYIGVATLLFVGLLIVFDVPGSILIGIVFSASLSVGIGASPWPTAIVRGPSFHLGYIDLGVLMTWQGILMSSVVFFVLFVDCGGVIVAISAQGESMLDDSGEVLHSNRAYTCCGLGVMLTSLLGTSPIVIFLESAAAVHQGGRTGLSAIVCSVFLGLSLFFSPLVNALPRSATAPVLVLVGSFMMGAVMAVRWDIIEEALPAFITISVVGFSCSVFNGIIAGFSFYLIMNTPMLVAKLTKWKWLISRLSHADTSVAEKRLKHEKERERQRVHSSYFRSEPLHYRNDQTHLGWI